MPVPTHLSCDNLKTGEKKKIGEILLKILLEKYSKVGKVQKSYIPKGKHHH